MIKKLWQIDKGFVIGLFIIIGLIVATVMFYFQGAIPIPKPEEIEITTEESDVELAMTEWFEQYMGLYDQSLLPRKQQINDYALTSVSLLQDGSHPVVQLDFTIIPKHPSDELTQTLDGVLVDGIIKCQWVLWIDITMTQENNPNQYTYQVTKVGRPAQYDIEQYYISGEQEKDEYEKEFIDEIPYEQKQYTYKIEGGIGYVSYDTGMTWAEIPLDLETLTAGDSYQNKLQEGSYVITPTMTAFVYGGVMNYERNELIPLSLIFSMDQGQTWNKTQINSEIQATRIKFLSFPTQTTGYVVIGHERTMSQELQTIFKTEDGGQTWNIVGEGPETWLIQAAGFITEDVGFMSYPQVSGMDSNLYRSEDGGQTFEVVSLPVMEVTTIGITLTPFVQPEVPYYEGDKLVLLVGQGPDGDYEGGRLMAKLESEDLGKTWTFVDYYEPEIQEIG